MDPFIDLMLYDITPDSMSELELETVYNEMIEGGDYECSED